jgi:hypothetical protein
MAVKTPIRGVFDGSTATGLAEFQSGDFIALTHGGLGASLSIGSAGQILKVNSGASALEFGSIEAIVNIDGATNLESATLAVGDKLLVSDGGTEGRVLLSQLDTLYSGTTKTLTNKTISGSANTLSNIGNSSLSNSSINFGGVTVALGASDTTPAFNLSDATSYPTSSLTGTITNAQLAGSIANSKLSNSAITVSDGSNSTATALGGTITFAGTTNEVTVAESSGTITVGLPDNVTIAGNLTVSGTTTEVSSTTINVADPLLSMATNNGSADAVDIGFYGLYDTSGSQDLYAGLFRDASDSGKFKIFKDNQAEPTTTVNTSGTGYAVGTLVANLEGNVTGNADTATALASGRTIASTGDVVWTSASFDGSGNVTGTAAIGTGVIVNADINASAGIEVSKLSASGITIVDESSTSATITLGETLGITGGSGVDTSISGDVITISGEDASTSNKGVASFSSDNFAVSSGAVTIKDSGIVTAEIADDAVTAAKLANTSVSAASYGSSTAIPVITVDAQGRLTAASTASISTDLTLVDDASTSATISLATDTLKISGGTGTTSAISGDTLTVNLDNTAVSAASYGSATAVPVITVDAQGRITAASTATTLANVVEDTTPQLGGNLDVQASEITTSTSNGNIKLNPNGTGVVEIKGDGSSADGTLQLNCSQNSHGVKIASPPHSAGQSYTLTLPSSITNGYFLKTDGSGNLSFAEVPVETKPTVSDVSQSFAPDTATTINIAGTNFVTVPIVEFIKTTGAVTRANTVSFTNSTTLSVNVTLSSGQYHVRVENPDGNSGRSTNNIITASTAPTFSTSAGSLGSVAAGDSVSIDVDASSDSTIAFSETTSVLTSNSNTPAGTMNLSLNSSTGVISGTAPSPTSETTYNFTLRATDAESQTADRDFSITVTVGLSNSITFQNP